MDWIIIYPNNSSLDPLFAKCFSSYQILLFNLERMDSCFFGNFYTYGIVSINKNNYKSPK